MKHILTAALVLALAPSTAHAAKWQRVAGNESTQSYVDSDSIRQNGGKTEVWTWSIYASPIGDGDIYSTRIRSEYDCAGSYFRTLEYSYFDKTGKFLSTEPSETINERKYSAPNSINEAIMEFVCYKRGGTLVQNPLTDAPSQFAYDEGDDEDW